MTKLDPVFADATKSLEVQHETVRIVYIQIAIVVSDCINSVDNEGRGKCSNFICFTNMQMWLCGWDYNFASLNSCLSKAPSETN